MKTQTRFDPHPESSQVIPVNEEALQSYEAAKEARTAFIIGWIGETTMAEPACSGFARSGLLLVINHSLISEAEKEAEKACINQYTVCIRATPSFPDAIAGLALWDENKPSLVCSNGAILSTLSAE